MLITTLAMIDDIEQTELAEGTEMMQEGSRGAKVYVLDEGSVRVMVEGNMLCDISEQGAVFGEMSALLSRNCTATVVVNEPSTFYVIDDLPTTVRKHPDISLQLCKMMADRLVQMNHELTRLKDRGAWWKFWQ